MNIEETLEKIYSLHQFNIKLGLEKIIDLLNYLGNPQNNFETIHVAGSNGKGSVSSYMSSILIEAGYKTGLYTSPHLVEFNERIRINGNAIENEYISKFISELDEYIKKYSPTFFEITTALAFKYFSDKKIDIAVIETGLGGRLDATNVINPKATVITTLSLEHTNILGDTLEQIAFEKAGIIKNNTNCFIGLIPTETVSVIKDIAEKKKSNLYFLKNYIDFNKNIYNIRIDDFKFHVYNSVLLGFHQYHNLALAILTLVKTKNIKDWFVINKGISNVLTNSKLQGRYEIIKNKPRIIFEAAHNSEGIKSFVCQFSKEYKNYDECVVIFGAMKDKNIVEMLTEIKPFFDKFLFTQINYERAINISELITIANQIEIDNHALENPSEYIINFNSNINNQKKCLVVLGSIYLLGKIKKEISEKIT